MNWKRSLLWCTKILYKLTRIWTLTAERHNNTGAILNLNRLKKRCSNLNRPLRLQKRSYWSRFSLWMNSWMKSTSISRVSGLNSILSRCNWESVWLFTCSCSTSMSVSVEASTIRTWVVLLDYLSVQLCTSALFSACIRSGFQLWSALSFLLGNHGGRGKTTGDWSTRSSIRATSRLRVSFIPLLPELSWLATSWLMPLTLWFRNKTMSTIVCSSFASSWCGWRNLHTCARET